MTKTTFQVFNNGAGPRYIERVIDEEDKNHKEDDTSAATEGKIFETPGR